MLPEIKLYYLLSMINGIQDGIISLHLDFKSGVKVGINCGAYILQHELGTVSCGCYGCGFICCRASVFYS